MHGLRQRLRARHGTERGLVRLWLARLEHGLGRLGAFEAIDWRRVTRLVFVCQGNINRSAYADALAARRGVETASFGLAASTGGPAHPLAIETARRRGLVDLSGHTATDAGDFTVRPGDLLVAMEVRQARRLAGRADQPGAQVTVIGLWGRPRRPHIHDPFYTLDPDYFMTCFAELERHTEALIAAWRDLASSGPAPS